MPYRSTTGRSSARSRVPPRATVAPTFGSQVTVPAAFDVIGTGSP
jgi:hypothetical protein